MAYQAHMDSEHLARLVKEEAIPRLLESRARACYLTLDRARAAGPRCP